MNTTPTSRRQYLSTLARIGLAGVAGFHAPALFAESYPSRPVKWIVPWSAGGGTDIASRITARYWEPLLGTSIVVDNKPGAQGVIGGNAALSSAPDGYTVLSLTDNLPIIDLLVKKVPYNVEKDITFISTTVKVPFLLLVRGDSPIQNVRDAVAAIRAAGGAMNYGSYGIGGTAHLAMDAFLDQTNTQMAHIPYLGSAPSVNALLSKQVDMLFLDAAAATPFVQSGKARAIGVSLKERLPNFPSVPTLHEQGVKNFNFYSWHGVGVRTGTPEPIVQKMRATLKQALETPELKKDIAARGFEVFALSGEEFRKHVATSGAALRELIDRRHLKLMDD